MAVFQNSDGKWVASYNGKKQYFTTRSAAMKAYEQMKTGTTTKSSTSSTSIRTTTSSTPSPTTQSTTRPTTSSVPSTVLAAQDLNSYYAALGKSLPSYSSRFSDPAFAAAAAKAGISQSAYTGSASQNTAILNQLKTTAAASTPTSSTGTRTSTTPGTSTPSTTGAPKTGTTPGKTNSDDGGYSSSSSTGGTLYPMGNYSLVRFQGQGPSGYMNDQTIWLVDPSTKTLRPFSSGAALSNFFDGEVDVDQIVVLSAADLMPGGALGSQGGTPGFQILSNEYAIQKDGSARRLDYSNAQLATRYGQPVNEEMEQTMFSALKGVFNMLEDAGISSSTINKIKNNDETMAFYVSAMAYGGYSIGDIYSDVKKRELGINNVSPISATANKSSYAATNDYQKASADTRLTPPVEMAGLNSAVLDLPVYQLPDEAFKTLVPILDYDSQEFKDAMASVETSYYDLLEQQLRASTEQEKAIADYNYQEWKKDVERNFGIALSDNALEAWGQIQQVYNQGSQAGVFGSGIQNENIDSYLRRVRQEDSRVRDEKMSSEEKQQMNYYLSAATPEQIKELVNTDPEKARAWGLIPSDEVKNALSLSALKEKYPNAKEEDLAQYISILLDENGNYRSSIYQKQMGTLLDLDPGSASMNSLTGIGTAKEQFQYSEAIRKALLDEEDAYKEFTKPDIAFLRNSDPNAFESVTGNKTSSGKTDNLKSIIRQAGSNLSVNPASLTSKTSNTSSGSQPTASQKASMLAQLESAKQQLAQIQARTATTTPTTPSYSTSSVSTQPTTKPTTTTQYKAPIGPVQPTQSYMPSTTTNNYSTANTTPSSTSGTSGSTLKSLLSKLKFW